MPDGQVLEFTRVTKRFNDVTAVSDLSARVEPGIVTAFLGPNGAGKTTSLRILLGQVRPTSGTATIGGVAYAELRHPLRTIGSVLEETVYRPRRSAARHLTIAAKANGIPLSRVDEVLSLVGLEHEAEGRVGSFSLGMRQRLSVAHALLGDPGALVFDEPANGLDPEGIRWMRLLMRRLADEGRTVLVSSHVLSEIEQVADHVLVLSKGQLVLSSGIETLADPSGGSVVVDSADRVALRTALSSAGFEVEVLRSGLRVRGGDAQTVGAIAASAGVALSTLVQRGPTLEDVFIELVRGGTLGPRAVAAASEYVAPSEAAPAVVEAEAGPETDADSEADAGSAADAAADADAAAEADAVADEDAAVDPLSGASVEAQAEPTAEASAVAPEAVTADAAPDADAAQAADADTGEEQDRPAEEGATTQSFDDILFGTGTAPGDENEDRLPEVADAPTTGEADAAASGVEVFDDLGEQDDVADGGDESDDRPEGDDPRSAAVTSMLAAAARAYYDDEPADYPLGDAAASTDAGADGEEGDASEGATGDASEDETSNEDAHWSVASTGVIDQVPAWTPDSDAAEENDSAAEDDSASGAASSAEGRSSADDEQGHQVESEHPEREHQNHEGEHQNHEGEHQNHEGEHQNHEGEHQNHEGEHQNHEGEHQNHEGEHRHD
ncbi:ATP-binding cassette domain-containing protein [Microbacterium sp. LMX7-1.2]|uniref:ATP-binding cassette domain-containing protein n=1 Tax=Microbacterium sp. LMX7-1.2 TaxID=3135252 RepID=UPI003429AA6E